MRNLRLQDLLRYRLPVMAKVSIMHRMSGALLFFLLPLFLYLFEFSLHSQFELMPVWATHPIFKLLLLLIAVPYIYHVFAGIRYLMLDLNWGIQKNSAYYSAYLVFALSISTSIVFAVWLFNLF